MNQGWGHSSHAAPMNTPGRARTDTTAVMSGHLYLKLQASSLPHPEFAKRPAGQALPGSSVVKSAVGLSGCRESNSVIQIGNLTRNPSRTTRAEKLKRMWWIQRESNSRLRYATPGHLPLCYGPNSSPVLGGTGFHDRIRMSNSKKPLSFLRGSRFTYRCRCEVTPKEPQRTAYYPATTSGMSRGGWRRNTVDGWKCVPWAEPYHISTDRRKAIVQTSRGASTPRRG